MQSAARLEDRAAESLEFIRTTLARSTTFTAVPGYGGVAMGAIGTAAAALAARQTDDRVWLAIWLCAAAIAAPTALIAMRRKAQRCGLLLWSAHGRRVAQGFLPALVAGAVLTMPMVATSQLDLLPATWLLSYGAGVVAGSSASVPVLAWLGAAFMLLGIGAAATSDAWRDVWLGAGFGGLHMIFGLMIAREHGG